MADIDKKLANLAEDAKTDETFENLDKMEKELELDKDEKENDGKETVVEKLIEESPAAAAEIAKNQEPY